MEWKGTKRLHRGKIPFVSFFENLVPFVLFVVNFFGLDFQ
jgi:hypothetical protein